MTSLQETCVDTGKASDEEKTSTRATPCMLDNGLAEHAPSLENATLLTVNKDEYTSASVEELLRKYGVSWCRKRLLSVDGLNASTTVDMATVESNLLDMMCVKHMHANIQEALITCCFLPAHLVCEWMGGIPSECKTPISSSVPYQVTFYADEEQTSAEHVIAIVFGGFCWQSYWREFEPRCMPFESAWLTSPLQNWAKLTGSTRPPPSSVHVAIKTWSIPSNDIGRVLSGLAKDVMLPLRL